MTTPLVEFDKVHQDTLSQFLKFFSKKKDECFKQVQLVVEDTIQDNSGT